MAFDMLMKVSNGIEGESKISGHEKQIDVLAWSWGGSQSGSFHLGGGGGSGKANVQDLSFTHYVDTATPKLQLACFNGEHLDEVTLKMRKAGKDPQDYLIVKMEKVLISSFSTGGSGGEDRLTENVTFNFAKVKVTYMVQDDKGTTVAGPEYEYDIEANKSK